MMLLKVSFILTGENYETLDLSASLLLFCFSIFFLLLIGLKALLASMASGEEITVCEDEVR